MTTITDATSVDMKSPLSVVAEFVATAANPAIPKITQREPVQIIHLSQGRPNSPNRQTKAITIAESGPNRTAAKIPGKKLKDASR
jgi:hypothetical protein